MAMLPIAMCLAGLAAVPAPATGADGAVLQELRSMVRELQGEVAELKAQQHTDWITQERAGQIRLLVQDQHIVSAPFESKSGSQPGDTRADDKRDLWTTFGIERRTQKKDFFFHNANSMIRRSIWEELPFDEEISGVEDREWARQVISRGYQVVYEPAGSVHHFHGIHHGRNLERSTRVPKVIELINHRGGIRA